MPFYDLPKNERAELVIEISNNMLREVQSGKFINTISYFSDDDTYIRKAAYLGIGRIYMANTSLQKTIVHTLEKFILQDNYKIRQTTINAAGEIGKVYFDSVIHFFDKGLLDVHHSVRNAVIGSVKKMGEVNPVPVLEWAKNYLHHPDKEIRREICHGIELRDRKHPEDILPMLQELQFDKTARVRNTLVHVLGQIAYKKDCLSKVIIHLKSWKNKELVAAAIEEIIDVHYRYQNFSALTQAEAKEYINNTFLQ